MELLTAVGSARTIANFVEGGQLATALNAIADVALEAAKDALNDVQHAVDKRAQVQQARTHLAQTEVALRKTIGKHG